MSSFISLKQSKNLLSTCKIISTKRKISSKESKEIILNNFGFEYEPDVLSDKSLISKILDSNNYLPKNDFIIDFNYEFSKLMVIFLFFFSSIN